MSEIQRGVPTAIKIKNKNEHAVCLEAHLCVEIVLINPSAPADRALQCVCLILRGTIARAPHTFTTSVRHRSNTGPVGARGATGGRTERGEEMLLVIVRRADMVDQMVPDVLSAERTPSRLPYTVEGFERKRL